VISSFADSDTESVWDGRLSLRLPPDIQHGALRKLRLLNRAKTLTDLLVPRGNRLEALKGDRKGDYSIRINDQWRITFRWRDGAAYHVRIEDYH
jgi:toxin HigB-1